MKNLKPLKFTAFFMVILILVSCISAGFVSAETFNDFTYEVKTNYDDDFNETKYIAITGYTGSSKAVTIPSEINGLPVTRLSYPCFNNNESITSVTVPSSVTYIDDLVFKGCTNLTDIQLPDTITYIGYNAFDDSAFALNNYSNGMLYCGKYLVDSDRNFLPDNITVKEGTLLIACFALSNSEAYSINLPSSLKYISSYAFSSCDNITNMTIPEGVVSIGSYAFEYCTGLKTIKLPSTLTSLGNGCFIECASLTGLDVPASVTVLPLSLIRNCKNITSFEIKDTVTDISSAFTGSGIRSIHIPANVKYMFSAFDECSDLATITVDPNNSKYYASNNILFQKASYEGDYERIQRFPCIESFTSYVVPEIVSGIEMDALTGNNYFKDLTLSSNISYFSLSYSPALENVFVNPANTSFTSVDGILYSNNNTVLELFPYAKNYSSFTVPSNVTEVDSYAFYHNPYLTEITVPSSVTKMDMCAIDNCENLKTVNMAPGEHDSSAINGCYNLSTINFDGTMEEWKATGLTFSYYECESGLYAYCSDGTIEIVPPLPKFQVGDVNMDGKLNIRDATAIQKHLAKIATLSDDALKLADFNGDGKVNVRDATTIQKAIAGLI